jgi:hypothetical protein
VRRAVTVLVVMAACGAGACIIGPKQDDPNSDEVTLQDAGVVADTSPDFAPADLGTSTDSETPPFTADGDAKADGDARDGDAAGDAVTDGVAEGG